MKEFGVWLLPLFLVVLYVYDRYVPRKYQLRINYPVKINFDIDIYFHQKFHH